VDWRGFDKSKHALSRERSRVQISNTIHFLCLYIGQIGNKRRKPENMQHGKDGTYAENHLVENHLVEKEKKKQKRGKDR
jgi:hypothetical protein